MSAIVAGDRLAVQGGGTSIKPHILRWVSAMVSLVYKKYFSWEEMVNVLSLTICQSLTQHLLLSFHFLKKITQTCPSEENIKFQTQYEIGEVWQKLKNISDKMWTWLFSGSPVFSSFLSCSICCVQLDG